MKLKGRISVYDDNGDIIVKISDTEANFSDVVTSTLEKICQAEVPVKTISNLKKAEVKEDVPNTSKAKNITPPAFLTEKETSDEQEIPITIEDIGSHVIQHLGAKYKGKTVADAAADANYVKWLIEKFSPAKPETKEEYNLIMRFVGREDAVKA